MDPLESILSNLVKKALMSAASTAGSKVGSAAAQWALDILGLDNPNDLADIKAELDTISTQVKNIDSKVSKLINDVTWSNATLDFPHICSAITTHYDNLQVYLAIPDQAQREAKIKDYIKNAHPPLDEFDTDLTEIDTRIRGEGDGLSGTSGDPLIKVFLETHWGTTWDKDPAKTHANILSVYIHAAQVQRLATTLLIAYREATDDASLADAARERLERRLKAQYLVMTKHGPDFVMLNDLATPGLQVDFLGFDIAPSHVVYVNCRLTPSPIPILLQWSLKRVGQDPNSARFQLTLNGSLLAQEEATEVISKAIPSNDGLNSLGLNLKGPQHKTFTYICDQVSLVQLLDQGQVKSPLVFSVEATDDINLLRMKLADGRTLGYLEHGYSGFIFELTNTEATSTNGLATLATFIKNPVAPRSTLKAWSRAFPTPAVGEGRFKPGYRVRYRVVHVNRFGESDKSDWILAPKVNEDHQDSEGYFGNATYYFPQIELAVDPTGRTEGYRIFRQFQGDVEEEVTGGGTFTGDPLSGKPVIFDDFMG